MCNQALHYTCFNQLMTRSYLSNKKRVKNRRIKSHFDYYVPLNYS